MTGSASAFLLAPRSEFVDIEVRVARAGADGRAVDPVYAVAGAGPGGAEERRPIRVTSVHRDRGREVVNSFGVTWSHGRAVTTEYNAGLSVFHDLKDHRLYGLGITPLTEIQTLVQTVYGRACALRPGGRPEPDEWRPVLYRAIHDELFGPRGPRVYDPRARALLDDHAPHATAERAGRALRGLWFIATRIMLPPLARLYADHDAARELQLPLRHQADLVRAVLPGVTWADTGRLLLRLENNVGLHLEVRCGVDADLSHVTRKIYEQVREYVSQENLAGEFGGVFSCEGYTFPGAP